MRNTRAAADIVIMTEVQLRITMEHATATGTDDLVDSRTKFCMGTCT